MTNHDQQQADVSVILGVRDASDDPALGLRTVATDADPALAAPAAEFAEFLRTCAREAGGYDAPRDAERLGSVDDTAVAWTRQRYHLYPVYVEKLTVVADADFRALDPPLPVPLAVAPGGEWKVPARVLRDGPDHFTRQRDAWRAVFSAEGRAALDSGGGLAVNVLEIPRAALADGSVDLRPLCMHALARDGSACDRGSTASQAAVANAFWQTFWATGALRAERGATFPVAFMPVDRTNPAEFAGPFRERYVSLRRRLFGRTAIVAHICESLTRSRALFFDRGGNRFVVAAGFDPAPHGITGADVRLGIGELNRCAFVDAYIRENRDLFAGWRGAEDALGAAARRPLDAASHDPADEGFAGCTADPAASDALVRIHRVVPYAGCAFLSEVVNHTDELRATGRIQDFDEEIIAATNSTFFLNFPEEYSALHSAMNDPVALLVENGETRQIRTIRRAAFVLCRDGSATITTRAGNRLLSEALIYEGESVAANGFTRAAKPFRENRFGPLFFGSVVVGDDIVETFEEMATEIPSNGWLIGDSEAYGGDLDPERAALVQVPSPDGRGDLDVRHAFAVGPMLVENGDVVPLEGTKEEFQPIVLRAMPGFADSAELSRTELAPAFLDCERKGVPPTRFPYDWDKTRAPRTAIGVRPDGTVVLVVVDGRANLPHSVGVTLAELARVMLNLGCCDAMNMDGGGSSVMFVNDPRAHAFKLSGDLREGVVNLPSDLGGVERLLPVPLVVARRKQRPD